MICDKQEWVRVERVNGNSRGPAEMAGREHKSGRMSQGLK